MGEDAPAAARAGASTATGGGTEGVPSGSATATPPSPPADPPGRRAPTSVPRRGRGRRDARAPYGWWPVAVIISVALVDRLESSVLSAILVDLQAEWGFSDTAGGMLSAAISIMGTALALPAGYLADRANRKNLLAIVVALWSLITLGSAVSVSFVMFFVTRLALAAADSIDNPSQVSLLADYYSVEVRPKVLGFHRMITFAGGALGTLYGGIVTQLWGWRAVFYIIIVPGLVVAWWCYRLAEPRRGEADARAAAAGLAAAAHIGVAEDGNGRSGIDGDEIARLTADRDSRLEGTPVAGQPGGNGNGHRPAASAGAATASGFDAVDLTQERGVRALFSQIGTVLRIRTIVLVYTGLAVLFFGLVGIFFWLPTFYQREFGLDPGPAATITSGITLFGVVGGTWIGGVIGGRVHGTVKGGRVVAGGLGMVSGSLVFPLSLQSSALVGQALFLLAATLLLSIAIPNLQSAIADALPANQRGVGFALLGIFTTFGAFGPLLVGVISDATGSLLTAFGYLLVPMALGGLVTLTGRATFDRDVERALDAVRAAARQATPTDGGRPEPEEATSREEPTHAATDEDLTEALGRIRGLGPTKIAALLAHFGSVEAVRHADVAELTAVAGIGPDLAARIRAELDADRP